VAVGVALKRGTGDGALAWISLNIVRQSRGSGAENEGRRESNLHVGDHCLISFSIDRVNSSFAEKINEGGVLFHSLLPTLKRVRRCFRLARRARSDKKKSKLAAIWGTLAERKIHHE
jgi:hypothetical protein